MIRAALLSLLCFGCAAAPPRAQSDALQELERATTAAIQRKDAQAMAPLLADDFVFRMPGQKDLSRAEFLQGVAAQPGEITGISSDGVKVTQFGEVAVITGVQRVKVILHGVEQSGAGAFADVCVWRGGRWQIALAYNVEMGGDR